MQGATSLTICPTSSGRGEMHIWTADTDDERDDGIWDERPPAKRRRGAAVLPVSMVTLPPAVGASMPAAVEAGDDDIECWSQFDGSPPCSPKPEVNSTPAAVVSSIAVSATDQDGKATGSGSGVVAMSQKPDPPCSPHEEFCPRCQVPLAEVLPADVHVAICIETLRTPALGTTAPVLRDLK